jgi:hypothetical protein
MTNHDPATPEPKSSETDPPAANQPVEAGDGENADGSPDEAPNASGRRANDPSRSGAPVPETPQVPFGKPDGEVDTSR